MVFIPSMMSYSYWVEGSEEIHNQIIITSKGKMERNGRWVYTGPLPGIY